MAKPSACPREVSIFALENVFANHQQLDLDKYKKNLNDKDFALLNEICFGVLRNYFILNKILQSLLNKPIKNKYFTLQLNLIVGIYQLKFLKIPEYAIINTHVNLAVKFKQLWAKGLVNATLRNFTRGKVDIKLTQEEEFNHPLWLIEKIANAYPNDYKNILKANNQIPPIYLRVNQNLVSTTKYLEILGNNNIKACEVLQFPNAIELKTKLNPTLLPNFADGFFSVQDLSAQIAATILDCQEEDIVLDAAAAPGGKTSHLLSLNPKLNLTACDISEKRLKLLQENLSRLKLKVKTKVQDLTKTEPMDNEVYDKILLDSPCSAIGVIRRHPEIRFLRTPKDIDQITDIQLTILKSCWQKLKPGGILLYITCSILPDENDLIIDRFLTHQQTARIVNIDAPYTIPSRHGKVVLPGNNNMDGFYFCKLEKDK